MNYADIKPFDVANGPGVRVSLFVSGCTHRCPGCFNQEAWDFGYGKPFTEETEDTILKYMEPDYIAGLTLLGGEPFEHANQTRLLPFLKRARAAFPEKNIWCFSGYLFDRDILGNMAEKWPETREMLACIDVLVDGEFVEAKKDLTKRFKGSSNQRTIDVKASLEQGEVILVKGYE